MPFITQFYNNEDRTLAIYFLFYLSLSFNLLRASAHVVIALAHSRSAVTTAGPAGTALKRYRVCKTRLFQTRRRPRTARSTRPAACPWR